ncbi:MAG: mechanosensitive ion channel [Clostridia bacterium]|nr:mechanosensitive ion channel [Clostridia bacterium]
MEMKKERMKKLGMDVLLEILGLIILYLILSYAQTQFSDARQKANSMAKIELAMHRMELHAQEADANLYRYDRFNQAMADALAYFYENNTDDINSVSAMAAQCGIKELYILNDEKNVVSSNSETIKNFKNDAQFGELLTKSTPLTIDNTRYYSSFIISGMHLILGSDYSHLLETQEEILSPYNSLHTISVGENGFVIAIDTQTGEILYHPDESMIGQNLTALDLSAYQCVEDTIEDQITYMAVIPKSESAALDFTMVLIALLVFAIVISLVIAFLHCVRIERGDPSFTEYSNMIYAHIGKNYYFNKTLWKKLKQILLIGLLLIFVISYYMQTLAALSSRSIHSDQKLAHIAAILDENKEKRELLTQEYNTEYAKRAQNIAYLLKEDPSLINADKLKTLARRAQVDSIYVFDANGATVATNTVFKDFVLSKNSKEPSYAFWNVINGYENTLVQDAVIDETAAQNYIQYIGTTRLDAPGLVQLGISPQTLKARLNTYQLEYVLDNIAVENQGFTFAANISDHTLTCYPRKQCIGDACSLHGLTDSAYDDAYRGYQTIDGQDYFVNSMKYDSSIIYVAVPLAAITKGRLSMALLVTFASFLALSVISSLFLIGKYDTNPTAEVDMSKIHTTRKIQSAASRWDYSKDLPWKERNAEQKLQKIISILLSIVGILIVIYSYMQRNSYDQNSILSYIINKQWAKNPNIFSLSYIILTVIEVSVIANLLTKTISALSINFGSRSETIGRLINNFIKYTSVIGTTFYCLNFLGIQASTLLASAGILTLVIGLGAQSLISDILAGIFIVFEGEFRVGDIVTIGDWRGTVLEIGIRSTKIEDASQNIKVFNNSSITGVINMTKKYSYAFCDVGIEYGESLEKVEALLKKELPRFKEKIPEIAEGPFYKGVISLGDCSVDIRILAQCLESDRVQLTRDLNREILLLFDKHHINIPFPQVVINQPGVHAKASRTEIKNAAEFNHEQKEAAKNLQTGDQ